MLPPEVYHEVVGERRAEALDQQPAAALIVQAASVEVGRAVVARHEVGDGARDAAPFAGTDRSARLARCQLLLEPAVSGGLRK